MTRRFSTISGINPDREESWQDAIFLTFDIDWAADAVCRYALDLVQARGASATWFVTHACAFLSRLREDPTQEVAAHPNFNPLLAGSFEIGSAGLVLDRMRDIVPEATAIRSHSLVQGSPIQSLSRERGFTHDCNDLIESETMELHPWRTYAGMTKVPHCWEDDVAFASAAPCPPADKLKRPGLVVLDFHPIHVFLNTETPDRYEQARPFFKKPAGLEGLRNEVKPGTRDWLTDVLDFGG